MRAILVSKDGKQRIPVAKIDFTAPGAYLVHTQDGKTYEVNSFDPQNGWDLELSSGSRTAVV